MASVNRARRGPPIVDRLSATRRVVVVDLPGHGQIRHGPAPTTSSTWPATSCRSSLPRAFDAVRVVGHSLGGVVVSAVAASGLPIRSVVNVDQPLKLDDFQDGLQAAAPALRDPAVVPTVS